MLEMMQQARTGKDGDIKKLPDAGIEKRLEEMIKVGGEERINRFRDQARRVSEVLGMEDEFLALLRHRHSVLLSGRPDCSPGEFKTKNNCTDCI